MVGEWLYRTGGVSSGVMMQVRIPVTRHMHIGSAPDATAASPQLIDTVRALLAAAEQQNHRRALVITGARE